MDHSEQYDIDERDYWRAELVREGQAELDEEAARARAGGRQELTHLGHTIGFAVGRSVVELTWAHGATYYVTILDNGPVRQLHDGYAYTDEQAARDEATRWVHILNTWLTWDAANDRNEQLRLIIAALRTQRGARCQALADACEVERHALRPLGATA